METTRNELTPYSKIFFNKLSNYLDTKIYYFGSIQRRDYFPQSSDIDVDIFTDNVKSTMIQLQNLLNVEKRDFHKFVYKLHRCNRLAHGYKLKYKDITNNFSTEILIFNEKYKYDVIREHNSKASLPFYVSYLLILLKTIYYDLHLMTKYWYILFKRKLLNGLKQSDEFIIIDNGDSTLFI